MKGFLGLTEALAWLGSRDVAFVLGDETEGSAGMTW